jgi:hypothetical protein
MSYQDITCKYVGGFMKRLRLTHLFMISAVIIIVMIAACTPAAERKAEIEVVKVTVTQTIKPTTIPTRTPKPTATQTSILQPTDTSTPTKTSTPSPTPTPTTEEIGSYLSPNKEWQSLLERGFFFGEAESYLFRVVSVSGESEWIVEHIVPDNRGPMGIAYPNPVAWSSDGQFMYFTHSGFMDGCGPFVMGNDLYQLDLETGQVTEIVPKTGGYWFALSQSGQKIAYLSFERGVVIRDLLTGQEIESQLGLSSIYEHISYSDLTWSPDDKTLLILGVIDLCVVPPCPTCNDYVIMRIDAESLEQKIIVENDTSLRRILNWTEPDKVWLGVSDGNVWLNPETGEMTKADE